MKFSAFNVDFSCPSPDSLGNCAVFESTRFISEGFFRQSGGFAAVRVFVTKASFREKRMGLGRSMDFSSFSEEFMILFFSL